MDSEEIKAKIGKIDFERFNSILGRYAEHYSINEEVQELAEIILRESLNISPKKDFRISSNEVNKVRTLRMSLMFFGDIEPLICHTVFRSLKKYKVWRI